LVQHGDFKNRVAEQANILMPIGCAENSDKPRQRVAAAKAGHRAGCPE
jgi:hypothetical protein